MPSWMPATGAERVLWLVVIFLVAGYMGGQWVNRRRSKRIGSWVQAGLGALGGRVAWKWLRSISAGAEITVQETRPPYRDLVIGYYLLTREFSPLWLFERLQGKHDLLSLRANLRLQPQRELDILPLAGKLRKELDSASEGQPIGWQELGAGLGLAMRGRPDQALLQRATGFVGTYGAYVERISLRRRAPHLMAFLRLSGLEKTKSDDLWRALGELVRG
jgi:hypothetical protein